MDKKLILFDVDGTLISYKTQSTIPKKTIKAINKLRQNGHIIALATGRSYLFAKNVMKSLGIKNAILYNGAQIVVDKESIFEDKIGKGVSINICDTLLNTPLAVFAFGGEKVYVNNITEESISYIEKKSRKKYIIKPLSESKNGLFSISIYGEVGRYLDFLSNIDSVVFDPDQCAITAKGVSKGKAMLRLAKQLDIQTKDIIAVGDGKNDIDMIMKAGIGIAVGGACTELKDVADIVSDDIENGGILKMFKQLDLL